MKRGRVNPSESGSPIRKIPRRSFRNPVPAQRHRGPRVKKREPAGFEIGPERALRLAGIEPQEPPGVCRHMRGDQRQRIGLARRHHRPDHVAAPEAPAEGKAHDLPVPLDHRAFRDRQQRIEHRPTLGGQRRCVERPNRRLVGRHHRPRARHNGGRLYHAALMLEDGRPRPEAEREIEPQSRAGGGEHLVAGSDRPGDLLHQPAPAALLLQTGVGDDHADPGEVRAHRPPHRRADHAPDRVLGDHPVADPDQHRPILGPMRPLHSDRQRMKRRYVIHRHWAGGELVAVELLHRLRFHSHPLVGCLPDTIPTRFSTMRSFRSEFGTYCRKGPRSLGPIGLLERAASVRLRLLEL